MVVRNWCLVFNRVLSLFRKAFIPYKVNDSIMYKQAILIGKAYEWQYPSWLGELFIPEAVAGGVL